MKQSRKKRQLFLCFIDICILIVSIPITLLVRNQTFPTLNIFILHLIYFIPTMLFWLILMYIFEFYVLEKSFDFLKTLASLIAISILTTLFGMATFYLFFSYTINPKRVLILYTLFSLVNILSWRFLYSILYFKVRNFPSVLFIGYNEAIHELIPEITKISYFGYKPLGVFDVRLAELIHIPELQDFQNNMNIKLLTTSDDFISFTENNKIDILVLGYNSSKDYIVRKKLFSYLNKNILIYSFPEFYETACRKVPLGALNDSWFLSEIRLHAKKPYLILKRFLDVIIATITLIIFSPIFIILSVLIKLESKGPVFFSQIREGQNGIKFSILKFRTMKVTNNDFAPTTKNDSRITRIGNFLRKTRLDEIPQMINILNGQMSLIGPRPERPELAVELEANIPYYRQRLLVKPGITGWDQISGEYHSPSIEDTIKKVQYDLYYIKNISGLLDISIFFKTVATVFKRSGR